MNGMRGQLFAGTGFAKDQDPAIGWGHEVDLLPQSLHRHTFTRR